MSIYETRHRPIDIWFLNELKHTRHFHTGINRKIMFSAPPFIKLVKCHWQKRSNMFYASAIFSIINGRIASPKKNSIEEEMFDNWLRIDIKWSSSISISSQPEPIKRPLWHNSHSNEDITFTLVSVFPYFANRIEWLCKLFMLGAPKRTYWISRLQPKSTVSKKSPFSFVGVRADRRINICKRFLSPKGLVYRQSI